MTWRRETESGGRNAEKREETSITFAVQRGRGVSESSGVLRADAGFAWCKSAPIWRMIRQGDHKNIIDGDCLADCMPLCQNRERETLSSYIPSQ